jgi:hypothetical protein
MNRRSPLVRRFGAALAIVVIADGLVCDLWAERHEVAVAHGTCAKHGARTHLAVPAAPVDSQAALGEPSPAHRLRRACRVGADLHEHCPVALASDIGARAPSVGPSVQLIPPDPGDCLPGAGAARSLHASPRRLLAAAPKTSPPPA